MKSFAVLAAVFIAGCSTFRPAENLNSLAINGKWDAVFNQVAINIGLGVEPKKSYAIDFAAENPKVVAYGEQLFSVEGIKLSAINKAGSSSYFNYRLTSFCVISSIEQCNIAIDNFNTYKYLLDPKPMFYALGIHYDKLPLAQQKLIEKNNEVRKYKLSDIGQVIDHQVRNDSTPGSNFGAEAGLAVGAVAYTNSAFPSSGKSTYTVGGDIGTMLAGALIGGLLFNRQPDPKFTHRYSIKSMDGKTSIIDVVSKSQLGNGNGICMDINERIQIESRLCTLDIEEFSKSLPL